MHQINKHLDTIKDSNFEAGDNEGSGWTQFLDGTRGAGKSTFLNSVKTLLEKVPDVKKDMAFIATIDPSRIESAEIILIVILQRIRMQVEEVLKDRRSDRDEQLREDWHRNLRGVSGGLSLFAKDYHPLDNLDPDLFLDWGLERANDSASLRSNLQNLFYTACKILRVKALMIAFDDADTNPVHALNLLECIRKYLDVSKMMVIVTGDLELYTWIVRQYFAVTLTGNRQGIIDLEHLLQKNAFNESQLRMIDHLEEQYLLKIFPISRRMQLQPLSRVMINTKCEVIAPTWNKDTKYPVTDVINEIIKRGLRIKTKSDIATFREFLLNQPLRSILQVMSSCAPHLFPEKEDSKPDELINVLSQSLQALALTSLYKYSIDIDAINADELPALTEAVFDLSVKDGDMDTAYYLRPMSADHDIKTSFVALAADIPKFCGNNPGISLRYMLRGPGSVSLYLVAKAQLDKTNNANDSIRDFKLYMGIGRREDSLDWARRATAVIALPHSVANYKARVVLRGVVGLKKNGDKEKKGFRKAIEAIVETNSILPTIALSIVNVESPSNMNTYASIFNILALIERMLSENSSEPLKYIHQQLTISAPSWLSKGKYEVVEESENSESEFPVAIHKLKYNIGIWLGSVNEDFKESLFPSAIFLGKVWSRIFFSLQNAAEDLKRDSDFFKIMEIYALCIINAFLIEEAEHHLDNLDSNSKPDEVAIDRSNPRTSAPKFVDKLAVLKHCRNRFPFTSIIVTCPLILGLLDSNHAYASVLDKFFRKQTTQDEIKELLCHKAAVEHLQKVAISGTSSQRSDPTTK